MIRPFNCKFSEFPLISVFTEFGALDWPQHKFYTISVIFCSNWHVILYDEKLSGFGKKH